MDSLCGMLHNALMQSDEISVFVAVLEAGSFVGAARRLAMPPSTVSARVAALEKRLGMTLIQRTTRQLRPTAAGERYFEECRLALRRLAAAEEELTASAASAAGLLRITAAVDIAQSLLPPIIAGFRQAYPETRLELIVTDRIVDLIADGIDLAIRVGPLRDSGLITRAFVSGPSGLFASAAYVKRRGVPKRVEDLAGHDLIAFTRMPGGTLKMMRGNQPVDIPVRGALACDDMMTVRALIELDQGIGFLPPFLAEDASTPLVRVLPQLSHRATGLFFVYPAQRYVPQRVRNFITFATAQRRRQRATS
jgi:DNA-binding transcriptional LysR family regulator